MEQADALVAVYRAGGLPAVTGAIDDARAPGDTALQAALAPTEGDWLYFVTVNPETGETVFSETYGEHLAAVEQFQQFLRDNPGWGG